MAQRGPPDDENLASLVHELQDVLTVIRGHAQIIQHRLSRGETPTPDRLSERMGSIDDATRRMALTIGRLIDINRRREPDAEEPSRPHRPPNNG